MKLERVRLAGFLSHHDTDWQPNGARLISLVGPNGAGKSTLASDALSFALFDQARGRTDDVVRLGETEASVLIEFTYNGARYRVERGRTTKAGGKSRLELAIADGETWRPLTRESIRETQAAIGELLRLDADTFATAVLLGQGQANRFAEATAGDRKRILSTVLGLDVYAAAEARARELARDLDARTAADRAQAERLEQDAEVLPTDEDVLAQAKVALVEAEAAVARSTAERASLEKRIQDLTIALTLAADVERQLAEALRTKQEAAELWLGSRDRVGEATTQIQRLERLLADVATVDAAAKDAPAARAEVDRLVAVESSERRLTREIADMDRAIRDLEMPHQQARAAWEARHTAAVEKVEELVAHDRAKTSVCRACGQPIDRDTALEQLLAARAAVTTLGEQPDEPTSIAIAKAKKVRLEANVRELAWEPAALIAARDRLGELERVAARAEDLADVTQRLEREQATITQAEADRARAAERGVAAAAQVTALQAKLAEADPIRAERSEAEASLERVKGELAEVESGRRQLERAIAGAEERIRILRDVAAQAAGIRERIAGDDVELGRLRRLVQAFGVTGIPARVIEGVLPELAGYANELLGELRPGMTLELRAQRAKRDGKGVVEALDLVVRDPVGERPLALFSGGERMSVSLALAVALSRLVARRAGARIESLVVDEPDGLDAAARRAFGQALRVIAHRGDLARVVVVSHHDDLAEFGDATYQVIKGPEGSVVSQVM